jgi:hypothetical protein
MADNKMFGMGTGLQVLSNFPVQSKGVGASLNAKPSGWDAFMTGAANFGGNFLVGVASGIQAYKPGNEYSSLAGGFLGASRPLQQAMDMPLKAQQNQFNREQEDLAKKSETKTKEDIYRSQTDRAVGMEAPDLSGLSVGLAAPKQANAAEVSEPFGFQAGLSLTPTPTTAADRVRKIMGMS